MEQEKLNEIIASHGRWLQDEGGKRADLHEADLKGAILCHADLRYADLCHADLRYANLRHANLRYANLRHADLEVADLNGANLDRAKLEGAILCHAYLRGAILPMGVYQIVGAGSCNRCTTYDTINDQVVCGCWHDGAGNHLDSFVRRIEEIYGTKGKEPDSKYYAEYMSAVAFFKAMKELKNDYLDMVKEIADEKREL